MEIGRTLSRELFLYLLDLEVKRSRRYQNFFCLLNIKLYQIPGRKNGKSLPECYQKLARWLIEELRESDILGSLVDDQLVALLPYADRSASNRVRSRFQGNLHHYDLKNEGYEVMIDQICFPKDGTDTADLVRKIMDSGATKGDRE